ncbi:hypothetical protein HK57_00067 [Aspergillus ustus]|uniref:Uncharacterized protein n=1 Tax=Aspergillus ustus TaxID=40382 RepID=A0A0C1C359_ASPUT|nr:hypothetical protein HK57_00067 [Aspergillus ustus]
MEEATAQTNREDTPPPPTTITIPITTAIMEAADQANWEDPQPTTTTNTMEEATDQANIEDAKSTATTLSITTTTWIPQTPPPGCMTPRAPTPEPLTPLNAHNRISKSLPKGKGKDKDNSYDNSYKRMQTMQEQFLKSMKAEFSCDGSNCECAGGNCNCDCDCNWVPGAKRALREMASVHIVATQAAEKLLGIIRHGDADEESRRPVLDEVISTLREVGLRSEGWVKEEGERLCDEHSNDTRGCRKVSLWMHDCSFEMDVAKDRGWHPLAIGED